MTESAPSASEAPAAEPATSSTSAAEQTGISASSSAGAQTEVSASSFGEDQFDTSASSFAGDQTDTSGSSFAGADSWMFGPAFDQQFDQDFTSFAADSSGSTSGARGVESAGADQFALGPEGERDPALGSDQLQSNLPADLMPREPSTEGGGAGEPGAARGGGSAPLAPAPQQEPAAAGSDPRPPQDFGISSLPGRGIREFARGNILSDASFERMDAEFPKVFARGGDKAVREVAAKMDAGLKEKFGPDSYFRLGEIEPDGTARFDTRAGNSRAGSWVFVNRK